MAKKVHRVALVGAPNCGKSSLFNRLTGSHAYVGNRAGVTVGALSGHIPTGLLPRSGEAVLTDLPGIRSLRPTGEDEAISCRSLMSAPPDLIVNVQSATTLERCIALTLELAEAFPDTPMLCAVNMCDELRQSGGRLDTEALSRMLGRPAVAVSAVTGEGIDRLCSLIDEVLSDEKSTSHGTSSRRENRRERSPQGRREGSLRNRCEDSPQDRPQDRSEGSLQNHRERSPQGRREDRPERSPQDRRENRRERSPQNRPEGSLQNRPERSPQTPPQATTSRALLADRAAKISAAVISLDKPSRSDRHASLTERADRLLTHPICGTLMLAAIMAGIFLLIFGPPGEWLTAAFEFLLLKPLSAGASWLCGLGLPEIACMILTRWVVGGVGAVISFMPKIMLLYLLLSLLEDSGYLARAAYLADPLTRPFGLSGHSMISVLLAFGCSVPAIAASRTLSDGHERRRCAILLPLIPCSARLPLLVVLSGVVSHRRAMGALFLAAAYLMPFCVFLVLSAVLRRGHRLPPFIVELPRYRWPRPGVAISGMLRQCGDFLRRTAGTVFLSGGVVWVLSALTMTGRLTDDPARSVLALVAGAVSPLLRPLGLDDWRLCAALLAGICAKEGSVATLGVLLPGGGTLGARLCALLTPASALTFGVFYSMYLPCAASIATMRREVGRGGCALGLALMLAAAYLIAYTVHLCA